MATKTKRTTSAQPKEPKVICQNRNCNSMGRYLPKSNFYSSRNISIGNHPYCKECVNKSIDIDNMQTVYDVLKILDTPFIKDVWTEALSDASGNYIDKYLELINNTYKARYADSRFSNSIFESEFEDAEIFDKDTNTRIWSNEWQGYYTKQELAYLDDYYKDLQNDFKIITRNHKDYARKIAQASLAMNDAYNAMRDNPEDKEAANAYNTAAANFDKLSKSAQFAESQRGANDVSLGCFGRVFDAVEKHNWVPVHMPDDKDLFDKIIDQFSNINKSL
ncbi:MAG: hypothetical protein MSA56_05910 [Clostridium sp.]|nr:hypothetical protein [Clostridium sp.]